MSINVKEHPKLRKGIYYNALKSTLEKIANDYSEIIGINLDVHGRRVIHDNDPGPTTEYTLGIYRVDLIKGWFGRYKKEMNKLLSVDLHAIFAERKLELTVCDPGIEDLAKTHLEEFSRKIGYRVQIERYGY